MSKKRSKLRWEDLPPHATKAQIWDAAVRALTIAAQRYQRRPSLVGEDLVLKYARDTFLRKREWLRVHEPSKADGFYAHEAGPVGVNWTSQLVRLSNRYGYLATAEISSRDDVIEFEAQLTLRAQRNLLEHCRTLPTKGGHTHQRANGTDQDQVLSGGKRYGRSRCGQMIPVVHFSDLPTCPTCLTGVSASSGRPRAASYITVVCPTCGAVTGEDCTASPDHPITEGRMFHGAREYLAQLPVCPVCEADAAVMCRDSSTGDGRTAPHSERAPLWNQNGKRAG